MVLREDRTPREAVTPVVGVALLILAGLTMAYS